MADLEALKREIHAKEPHERLVLAGQLLERASKTTDPVMKLARTRVAHAIAYKVVTELGAALAMHDMAARRG